jgi:hypothetical protein
MKILTVLEAEALTEAIRIIGILSTPVKAAIK